jgi:DNA-binding NarL/FixJ family response regulator
MYCPISGDGPITTGPQIARLRVAANLHSPPQPCHAPPDDKVGSAIRRPVRILVVEDDYFVAAELEHRLQQAGFEVIGIAVTADEAVQIAAAQRPHLVIMDIRLNGPRDGIDAAIALHRDFGIRSIFASAHGDRETRNRAEAAKPLGWLEKPYSPASLISLVNIVLSTRE